MESLHRKTGRETHDAMSSEGSTKQPRGQADQNQEAHLVVRDGTQVVIFPRIRTGQVSQGG